MKLRFTIGKCIRSSAVAVTAAFLFVYPAAYSQEANEYVPVTNIGLSNNTPEKGVSRESLVNFTIDAIFKTICIGILLCKQVFITS